MLDPTIPQSLGLVVNGNILDSFSEQTSDQTTNEMQEMMHRECGAINRGNIALQLFVCYVPAASIVLASVRILCGF